MLGVQLEWTLTLAEPVSGPACESGEENTMRRVTTHRGMTLIELLTVIAIVMVIVALALPNFASMMRAQKWSSATTALQNTLLRCQTLAVTDRRDYSLELCSVADNASQYFRMEVESAALESIPELNDYYHNACQNYFMRLPIDWVGIFVSGGGVINNYPGNPWGQWPATSFAYTGPRYDVKAQDWRSPNEIQDNRRIDENIFLPIGILIDFDKSLHLMNYDKPPSGPSAMPQYGWDYTKDLRFNMTGTLVQAQNPEIVLKLVEYPGRKPEGVREHMRLQLLRSTARLRTLKGL